MHIVWLNIARLWQELDSCIMIQTFMCFQKNLLMNMNPICQDQKRLIIEKIYFHLNQRGQKSRQHMKKHKHLNPIGSRWQQLGQVISKLYQL